VSGHDIFISYCREERPQARRFAETFAQEGFSVWWDAEIHSGDTFDEVIEKELRAAKAVVVLWSPRSVASRWVRAEATLADRNNKLVPIIIEPCNLPIIFELTHAAELAEWTGDTSDLRWKGLVKDLRRLVGHKPVAEAAKAEAAQPANDGRPAQPSCDELIEALDRIAKAKESPLSEPTPAEREQAQFYQRADEYRQRENENLHCLLRLDGEAEETLFVIPPTGAKVGRAAPADLIVPGSGVSRSHCMIELAGDQLRVTDLNSTNGTFIDNKRIERSAVLPVGSMLRVGNVSFEHELRSRGDLDAPIDPKGLGRGDFARQAGLARG